MTPDNEDAETGLPLVRSWTAVYLWVLAATVLWIGLLTVLTRFYS